MKLTTTFMLLFALAVLSGPAGAGETEDVIQVKGEASLVVKPDVAHCFLVVADYGKDYEASTSAAHKKLAELKTLLKATLKQAPEVTVLKMDNRPRAQSFDQQRYLAEMAKAIKGETPGDPTEAPAEVGTHITVYFTLTDFSRESILALMSTLAEKGIAFENKQRMEFDFSAAYEVGKSAIYFGLLSSDKQLEVLAAEAYRKAEHDAQIIAVAIKKRLVGLKNITGCGDLMEGNVTMPDKSNLTGKILGPLSSDPARLMIRLSKDFGFRFK